jgi:hypothetical protein
VRDKERVRKREADKEKGTRKIERNKKREIDRKRYIKRE